MSRTDLGPIDESDIKEAGGLEWNVDLSTYDMSSATRRLFFQDSISQSGEFELDIVVNPGEINGGDALKVSKDGIGAFYGVVTRPESSSQGGDKISGGGASELLRSKPITAEYIDFSSVDVVNDVFSQVSTPGIRVGQNEELTSGSGSVDARAEDEGALTFLNRVVQSHGGEWYVSYDSGDGVFEFNVVQKLESGSVQKTFTENNTREIKDTPVVDETYDAVVVRGYGDGEDQVRGVYPSRDSWPSDPRVLSYTDKTILSEEEATTTAENVYDKHSEWRSIYVYPSNMQELLKLGDKVQVNESRSGVDGEFRVVARRLNLDFREESEIEYVLSDKPLGIIDEAEDVKEQTKSETDYEQGAKNKYSDKQSDQANSQNPLRLEINIPEDVEDSSGKNRVKSLNLNYTLKDFRQYLDSDEISVLENKAGVSQSGEVKNNQAGASQGGSVTNNKSGASQGGSLDPNTTGTTSSGGVLYPSVVLEGFDVSSSGESRSTYTGSGSYTTLTSISPGQSDDIYLAYYAFVTAVFKFTNNALSGDVSLDFQITGSLKSDGTLFSYVQTNTYPVSPNASGGSQTHLTVSGWLPVTQDAFDPSSTISLDYAVDGPSEAELDEVVIGGTLAGQEAHDHNDDIGIQEPDGGHGHTENFSVNEPVDGHPHEDDFSVNEPDNGHPHNDDIDVSEPDNGHPHNSSGGNLNININDSGKGDEVEIVIDGDTQNSIVKSADQMENINLLEEYSGTGLETPGFHEIEIYPNAASYTIGEAVLDYYKNT